MTSQIQDSTIQDSVAAVNLKEGDALMPAMKEKAHSKRKKIHAPAFVRQHVGYIALFTSWFVGLLYASSLDMMPIALSLIVVAVFFLMQEPIALLEDAYKNGHAYRKRWQPYAWLGGLAFAAVMAGIPLLAKRPEILWLMLPALGLLALYLVLRRNNANRLILAMISFAIISVATPIARIAADPAYSWQELIALWVLPTSFFCLTVMTLHIRMTGEGGVKPALYFSGLIVTIIGILIGLDIMPSIAMAAILVQIVKLGYIATDIDKYHKWPIRSVNTIEIVFSLLFLIINAVH